MIEFKLFDAENNKVVNSKKGKKIRLLKGENLMSGIFENMIRDKITRDNDLLYMTMDELIVYRNSLFSEKYIDEYETKYVKGGMKDSDGLAQEYPTPSYLYIHILGEIENTCRVMEYKSTCASKLFLMKTFNEIDDKIIIQKLKNEIKYNPYISYRELIDCDLELDIDVMLEYLIDTKKLTDIRLDKKTKYGYRKWKWNE